MDIERINKKNEELKHKPAYTFKKNGRKHDIIFDNTVVFITSADFDVVRDLVHKFNAAYFEGWLQRERESE